MKLLFIRHTIALERYEWNKDDILRPISEEGLRVARDFFKHIARIYPKTATIITSKATRALQTAEILQQAVKNPSVIEEPLLNPGASFADLKKVIDKYKDYESVYLVGHEPDFSTMVGHLCSDSLIALKLKKPSLVEVKLFDTYKGELRAVLQPKTFDK